jgi:hypothetical protein
MGINQVKVRDGHYYTAIPIIGTINVHFNIPPTEQHIYDRQFSNFQQLF